jgi:hypothetical protein
MLQDTGCQIADNNRIDSYVVVLGSVGGYFELDNEATDFIDSRKLLVQMGEL